MYARADKPEGDYLLNLILVYAKSCAGQEVHNFVFIKRLGAIAKMNSPLLNIFLSI